MMVSGLSSEGSGAYRKVGEVGEVAEEDSGREEDG